MVFFKFIFVFLAFNPEKSEAEEHSQDEAADHQLTIGNLRSPDREDDGQAAADQDSGIGGAESGVDGLAGSAEISEIPETIDQVRAEQPPEKHNFGGEEDPHAKIGGVTLLLFGGEVMQQSRAVDVVV
jgi:hypothetical protein